MPEGARILCVQVQHGEPQLWALVDEAQSTVGRVVLTFGTGHELTAVPVTFVGTYQLGGGELVYHVFDGGEL
jgi:hypothetical protein